MLRCEEEEVVHLVARTQRKNTDAAPANPNKKF
jgi:hypothetical protein